jgi:hypothetical protein
VFARTLQIDGQFGGFADRLLTVELPDLPAARRDDTVAFCCRRADGLPTPLRLGVTVLAAGSALAARPIGRDRVDAFLRGTTLPLVGELARLVRSLAVAHIWERWPDTTPSGGPGSGVVMDAADAVVA